jgi:hypothetical protein
LELYVLPKVAFVCKHAAYQAIGRVYKAGIVVVVVSENEPKAGCFQPYKKQEDVVFNQELDKIPHRLWSLSGYSRMRN